jgi:hypothetical protein
VSKLIGGDWNRKPFPAIPVLDSLLVWSCIWLHLAGLCEDVSAFLNVCTAGSYGSCFDHQQTCNHRITHLVPEVTD